MKKSIIFATLLLSTSLQAQECTSLCNAENWVMPSADFITAAIANGEDVNALDEMGTPPIIHAVRFANPAQLNALIAAGADVNMQNKDGETLLHFMAQRVIPIELHPYVLESEPDLALQDNTGQTAYDHALMNEVMGSQIAPLLNPATS